MRGLVALCAVLMLGATAPLPAQDLAPAPLTEGDVIAIGTDIPGRLTVPVTIGTSGPFPFTIDTGAERTVISHELARLLGLARGRDVRVVAIAGAIQTGTAVIPSLGVNSVQGAAIEAPMFFGRDLGAPGLLGLDTLQNRAVSIDFDRQQMTVQPRPKRRSVFSAAPDEIVVRAKSLLGQLVVTDAYYRGHRIRVVLDTGTAVSIGNLALKQRLDSTRRTVQPISVTGVSGAVLAADYTNIGEVAMGGVVFTNLPVAFADAAPFRRLGLNNGPALLLGMDALRLFKRVDIDFANREIRLVGAKFGA